MMAEQNNDLDRDSRPRVLVADDDIVTRRMISYLLKADFDVTLAKDGTEACEQVRLGADFDVASLDLRMPLMPGIETLKAIRQDSPTTQVLIVTAHSDLDSARKALKLGAYDYIDKPIDVDAYRAAIERGVRLRRKAIDSEEAKENLAFVKAQLIQSEKFAAIGQLIAGVAHELNNPIAAIAGLSELLLADGGPAEKDRNKIENIHQCAELCQSIVQRLLAFSRKSESIREPVQVNTAIEDALGLKQHDFTVSGIQVRRQLDQHIPPTMADPHALQQVFLNMIHNAHQAMAGHCRPGVLTVRSRLDDEMISIRFQDTGPGIPADNLQKIFEPLFTTKERGEGTGLGLSICYEIIREHGGNIYVASEHGDGACFVVELPVVSLA